MRVSQTWFCRRVIILRSMERSWESSCLRWSFLDWSLSLSCCRWDDENYKRLCIQTNGQCCAEWVTPDTQQDWTHGCLFCFPTATEFLCNISRFFCYSDQNATEARARVASPVIWPPTSLQRAPPGGPALRPLRRELGPLGTSKKPCVVFELTWRPSHTSVDLVTFQRRST